MTCDYNLLVNAIHLRPTHPVGLGDGRVLEATAMGDVLLRRSTGDSITLMGVLYIPELQCNLFSMARAADAGATANFNGSKCYIQQGRKNVLTATRYGYLYTLDATTVTGDCALVAVNKQISSRADLWHRRYGHLNYGALSQLKKDGLVDGLDVSSVELKAAGSKFCEPCVMGKQHRQPFPNSTTTPSKRLELVHMDVLGPMETASMAGHKYVATFLDDYSGYSAIVPLQRKSEVTDNVIKVLNAWRVQTGEVVQRVRTETTAASMSIKRWLTTSQGTAWRMRSLRPTRRNRMAKRSG
jgi:hypothetical protein